MLVDTHCHLFDIKGYGVKDIYPVVVGYSHASNIKAASLPYVYALGVAPQSVLRGEDVERAVKFIKSKDPLAIGEIGLDYKWAESEKDIALQKAVFEKMIKLADSLDLPLIIHTRSGVVEGKKRDAVEEAIEMLGRRKYLMHFFSGTREQAERAVKNGGIISIIHLHSKERREVIKGVDLSKLVVESDSPYVGRTPDSIKEAIKYIADVKKIDEKRVADYTVKNAEAFFGVRLCLDF